MSSETSAASSASPSTSGAGQTPAPSFLVKTESESEALTQLALTAESPLSRLPVQLDVTVPIPEFRVRNLLSLEKGMVLESLWSHGEDVPLWCGGVQLVWTEFEVVDQKLAVRVTRVS